MFPVQTVRILTGAEVSKEMFSFPAGGGTGWARAFQLNTQRRDDGPWAGRRRRAVRAPGRGR